MMTLPEKSENIEVLWSLSQVPVGEEAHGLEDSISAKLLKWLSGAGCCQAGTC